jgi:hypothetical protein
MTRKAQQLRNVVVRRRRRRRLDLATSMVGDLVRSMVEMGVGMLLLLEERGVVNVLPTKRWSGAG